MILYFSGTGNSEYVAKIIAKENNDDLLSINDWMKNNKKETLIFVCPIYSGRIPPIVENFIKQNKFEGNTNSYFITTCFQNAWNSEKYIKKLCMQTNLQFQGAKEILMPQNYIMMYPILDKQNADKVIESVTPQIYKIAKEIKNNSKLSMNKPSFQGKIMSIIVNPIFYSMIVKTKNFYTTDKCTKCGMCVDLCSMNNIKILNDKPQWGNNCIHCTSCINCCPNSAIEYGKKTIGKERYYNKNLR